MATKAPSAGVTIEQGPAAERQAKLLQGVALATCVLGIVLAATHIRSWHHNRDTLLATLDANGSGSETVERKIRREIEPYQAQLEAARAIVFNLLPRPGNSGQADPETRRAQLAAARALAAQGLAQQPNNWQGTMLIGATTYLQWSLDRDRRLFTEFATWQDPLLKALNEAPSQAEPRRILATAYLEVWPALSPEKKQLATDLLRTTFADDPQSFAQLGAIWMAAAPSLEAAFAIIPPQPAVWTQIKDLLAEGTRWRDFCEAHRRYLDSLQSTVERELEDGLQRLRLGDVYHSRTRFARALANAPTDLRFAPLANQAIASAPPGFHTGGTGGAIERWLRWAETMDRFSVQPLAPAMVSRLAAATENRSPPENALIALLGNELNVAERIERTASGIDTRAWLPYWLAKARWLLAQGRVSETEAALAMAQRAGQQDPDYWLLRKALAVARDDRVASDAAEATLGGLRADRWPRGAWRTEGKTHSLTVLAAHETDGLEIETGTVDPRGGVIALRWDGETVQIRPVRPGDVVTVAVKVETNKLHQLEWIRLTGTSASPAGTRLGPGWPLVRDDRR